MNNINAVKNMLRAQCKHEKVRKIKLENGQKEVICANEICGKVLRYEGVNRKKRKRGRPSNKERLTRDRIINRIIKKIFKTKLIND